MLEFYQYVHGKRLLNGMIARLPADVLAGYRAHPALRILAGEPLAPDANGRDDLRAVLDWLDVRYVLVHSRMMSDEQLQRVHALLGAAAFETPQIEDDLEIYRIVGR